MVAVSGLTTAMPLIVPSTAVAATTVTSQAELEAAISGSEAEINLGASFSTASQININRSLTLNGNGYTISPVFSGASNNDTVIAVVAGNPTILNLVIEGVGATNVQGIQVWQSAATLLNVTSRNNDKAGIHVNGSTVNITNATTAYNGGNFGGIMVSGGTANIGGQSHHTENSGWIGGQWHVYRSGGTVNDLSSQYNLVTNLFGYRTYQLKPAPAVPVISSPTENQKIVNASGEVTVTWGAVSGANSYDISIDGGAWVNTASATSYTTTLSEGTHTVSVRSVALSGLTSAASALRNFKVGIPPVFELTSPTNGQKIGTAATNEFSVTGTFTDPAGGYVFLQLVKPGVGSVGAVTTHAPVVNGTLATFDTTGFSEGDYTLYISPTDYLGNSLPTQSLVVHIDPTAPATPANLRWENSQGVVANGAFTKLNSGAAVWDASADADVDHYVYRYWNDIAGSAYNSHDSAWVTPVSGTALSGVFNQGDGTHYISIAAVDTAGNVSAESAPYVVRYDGTGPTYNITNLVNGQVIGTVNSGLLVVRGNFADNPNGSGANYIQMQLVKDGLSQGISTVHGLVSDGVIGQFSTVGLASGTYQMNVLGAADVIGNWAAGPQVSLTIVIDNDAPVVTISDSTSNSFTPLLTGAVNDPTAVVTVKIGDYEFEATNNGDGTWQFQVTEPLALGEYEITVSAADAYGNITPTPSLAILTIAQTPVVQTSATVGGGTNTPTAVVVAVVPAIVSPAAAAVLGDSTTTEAEGTAEVEGASTVSALAEAVDTDSTDGTVLGLAWYWWLLIIAAVALLGWWFIAAWRRRKDDDEQ